MQGTDTKGIGESLAFGSTLLFASVFGMFSFGLFMLLKWLPKKKKMLLKRVVIFEDQKTRKRVVILYFPFSC